MELLIPIMAIHHDARHWGQDAAQFNPARFAGGAARAAKHPLAFIPFGLGARMCVGQNLARLEAKLTMAVLLRRFQIRTSPNYVHAPTVLMLLYPHCRCMEPSENLWEMEPAEVPEDPSITLAQKISSETWQNRRVKENVTKKEKLKKHMAAGPKLNPARGPG
ncbi:Secologanin synthase [Triticum urartu]|uniref:Secologanin synthase n=1 Tax=Triticum urartu TaxID=4572 RepID=M7YCN5_TRIUA|nr:Secologanin synthase [Triticum urartu]